MIGRYAPVLLISTISILAFIDVFREYSSGETTPHLIFEVIIATLGTIWSFYLLLNWRSTSAELVQGKTALAERDEESKKWREEYSNLMRGVAIAIDEEFSRWGLTPAEKEVGLMLLKGLSFKDISDLRKTSEKTIRQQATNIYQKSGLPGRAELAAYFLDDFLVES